MNMTSITIEEHLDKVKTTYDELLNEVVNNPITTDGLRSLFLKNIKVDHDKFKDVLTDIELLFDNVPNGEYNTLFIKYFDVVSKLDGSGFESWLNEITFNELLDDDIQISYLCLLYDLELVQWFLNALKNCPTNPKQKTMICLQNYQNLVEGYFLKTLNIIIYAMTFPSGTLKIPYTTRNGKNGQKTIKNYGDVVNARLYYKLLALEKCSNCTELIKIAKVCNKDLRNAVAHHSYKLNQTEQKIEYEHDQISFKDFDEKVIEFAEYREILVDCFNYYSIKCFLKQQRILTD